MSTPTPPSGPGRGPHPPAPPRPGELRPDDPYYYGGYGPVAPQTDSQIKNAPAPPTPPPSIFGPSGIFGPPSTIGPLGNLVPLNRDFLALPTNRAVEAAANPDPWRGRNRFVNGNPTEITILGEAFAKAGGDFDEAHALSRQTQKLLADGFTNDGTPVYDEAAHIASLPKNFPDAATHLSAVARQLGTSATDLSQRTLDTVKAVNKLLDDLGKTRTDWDNELKPYRGRVLTEDQLDTLRARRDQLAAEMQKAANAVGKTVDDSVTAYEGTLADCMRVLSSIGYVPPDDLDAGPGDVDFNAASGTAAARANAAAINSGGPGLTTRLDEANHGIAQLTDAQQHGATLTPAQAAYVRNFYDELAKSGTLPRLEGAVTTGSANPVAAEHTLSTIANGLMTYSRANMVPGSVTDLLPGLPRSDGAPPAHLGVPFVGAFDGRPGRAATRGPNGWTVKGLSDYEGIAGLLSRATVPGGTEFTRQLGESALHAKQDLNTALGPIRQQTAFAEHPGNQLLGLVAKNPAASQALLSDPTDRDVLLGAGWTDGSGAAAVLRSATAPAQATPELATASANLTRDTLAEIGQHPYAWRDLIPAGSQVSNALTEIAADHIGAFGHVEETKTIVLAPERNGDGSYSAGLRIGLAPNGDDREGFIKFLAAGHDVSDPRGNVDIQRFRTAADQHVIHQIADSVRAGNLGYDPAIRSIGNYDGVISTAQRQAILDEHTAVDKADAAVQKDLTTAIRVGERIAAVAATKPLKPIGADAFVKDSINVLFDSVLPGILPPPEPQAPLHAAQFSDSAEVNYTNYSRYLQLTALNEAGALPHTPHTAPLLQPDGSMRPYSDILADHTYRGEYDQTAAEELGYVIDVARPGDTTWAKAIETAYQNRNNFQPGAGGAPQAADVAPFDNQTRYRIRLGESG